MISGPLGEKALSEEFEKQLGRAKKGDAPQIGVGLSSETTKALLRLAHPGAKNKKTLEENARDAFSKELALFRAYQS